jgi:hypothetical protein
LPLHMTPCSQSWRPIQRSLWIQKTKQLGSCCGMKTAICMPLEIRRLQAAALDRSNHISLSLSRRIDPHAPTPSDVCTHKSATMQH